MRLTDRPVLDSGHGARVRPAFVIHKRMRAASCVAVEQSNGAICETSCYVVYILRVLTTHYIFVGIAETIEHKLVSL